MPIDITLEEYIGLGVQIETDLIASPVMDLEAMTNYWLKGLLPKFDQAKFPARNEMDRLVGMNSGWCIHDIANIVIRESTAYGERYEGEEYFANGKDFAKILSRKVITPREGFDVGARTHATDTRREPFSCPNSHCDSPHSHSTEYCVSYGGAKEGIYNQTWPQEFVSKLKKKLAEKIAKLGDSKN